MAPALTTHRDAHAYDAVQEADKLSHRRRALVSVDNNPTHMEEDDMGLQNQPSLAKDSQEMEQILSDLGNTDIVQADLLQAIKTLEGAGDGLPSGDPDSIFPLTGFDLTETENSEGDAAEDKIRLLQVRLERKCAFLLRRLRILQARAIGKRMSEEVTQIFDKSTKGARKDGGGRPLGLKALLKKIETTAALQASAASRSVAGPKYYRAGTSKGDASKSASLGIPSGTFTGLADTAGALRFHLSVVKHGLDSDATASSSGAESNDEAVTYNNPHQQPMPIEKRALWTWQKARAGIASSWCWIQAQIQELEYKIRQHNDLQQQVREAKGPVELEGEPVGYEGRLPGADADADAATCTCARVRPLRRETFKKRKLLQMHNLHIAAAKAAKSSDISCSCQHPVESCAVCTGRADATQPLPPFSTLAPAQRIALADPGYHPVLSDIKDAPPSVHLSALSSRAWFRPRFSKAWRGAHHSSTARVPPATTTTTTSAGTGSTAQHHVTPRSSKHMKRQKRGRPPLSRRTKERDRDEDTSTSSHEKPRGRPSTETRSWRRQSYDIDNIVIPQSVAASTRPEILTYKEIITPKWRVIETPETPMNNGVSKSIRMSFEESEDEDMSELAISARHLRAEGRERARYLRKRSRRAAALADHCDDTCDLSAVLLRPMRVERPRPHAHAHAAAHDETVRPYTPRHFPLSEDVYADMLANMPDGYRPTTPEPSPLLEEDDDISSSLSPMSPLVFDGDDPDDAEWNPNIEKSERRRSGLK